MNPDERLDQLFAAARQQPGEIPGNFGFETRLLASIREERAPKNLLGLFVWRLLPAFAAITLAVVIYTDESTPTTDLAGRFLGENALVELLAD